MPSMKRKKAMLIAAGQNGDVAAIRELVAAGAPVDAQEEFEVCPDDAEGVQNGGGMTALHYAAAYGHEDAVDALVGAGANLETADVYGSTALMEAAQSGNTLVVRQLLQAGADRAAVNKTGKTALNLAKARGKTAAAGLLAAWKLDRLQEEFRAASKEELLTMLDKTPATPEGSPVQGDQGRRSPDGGTPGTDYNDYDEISERQLRNLCDKRGLRVTGVKQDLMNRLESYDYAQEEKMKEEGSTEGSESGPDSRRPRSP